MNILEALHAVKDADMMAYRRAWLDDPILKDTVIIWNGKRSEFVYWYCNAPVPERYADDDPRVGADVGVMTIANVLADDWETQETWKVVKT